MAAVICVVVSFNAHPLEIFLRCLAMPRHKSR